MKKKQNEYTTTHSLWDEIITLMKSNKLMKIYLFAILAVGIGMFVCV